MRFFGIFLAGLVLLPGCMHVPAYKCQPLQSMNEHCVYRGVEKNVIVRAKVFSQDEKKYFFNNYARNDGQSVIYFSIHNLSRLDYVFSGNGICIKQIPYQEVIESMKKTSSRSRFVGGSMSAGVALPATGWACAAFIGSATVKCPITAAVAMVIGFAMSIVAVPFLVFGTAFLVQGIKSITVNNRIKRDIAEKIMDEPVVIPSGGQYEGLIFVKVSDYTPQFTLVLQEKDAVNNTITFNVDLSQN